MRAPDVRAGTYVTVGDGGYEWTVWSHGSKSGMFWLVRYDENEKAITYEAHAKNLRPVRIRKDPS